MNKNWFYRVLALALVAMLAVPMFAFAEEDVLAPAAETPAAELATTLEGEELEPIAKRSLAGVMVFDIYLGYSVVEDLGDFDINLPYQREFQLNLVNSDGSKESFKSSNKKVASVSPTGFVTLYGVGKVTITCTGKVNGKKKTTKFSLTAKDPTNPDSINGHFYEVAALTGADDAVWGFDLAPYGDFGSEDLLGKSDDGYYPGMGFVQDDTPAMVYEPVPFNGSDWVGLIYENGYHYKHSNAKAMFFDGNNHIGFNALIAALGTEATSPVDKPFKASAKFWYDTDVAALGLDDDDAFLAYLLALLGITDPTDEERDMIWNAYTYDQDLPGYNFPNNILVPVFYKPGKNTLTIKTQATAGLKSYTYTCKFDIAKQKITLRRGTDKELQKRAEYNDEILYQVETLDIQSMDKVVLTMKIYNGTGFGFTPKDVEFAASVRDTAISNMNVENKVDENEHGDYYRTPFLQYGLDFLGDDYTTGKTVRNNKVKGSVKPHKTTTLTITFENTRNGDFNIKSLGGHVFRFNHETQTVDYADLANYSQSSKNALEVISPYPDVWDKNFQFNIDWFGFGRDWDDHFLMQYAFDY